MNDITPPRSYPDALLDEIARRVYYTALEKVERELRNAVPDTERLTAFADCAAAASAQIMAEEASGEDDGDF